MTTPPIIQVTNALNKLAAIINDIPKHSPCMDSAPWPQDEITSELSIRLINQLSDCIEVVRDIHPVAKETLNDAVNGNRWATPSAK